MSIYAKGRLEQKIIVPILSKLVSKEYVGRIRFHYRRITRKLASHLGREVSERIIEYPWILKNLDLEKKRVLDVGCSGSFLSHELIARGYGTYGIDLRFYPEKRSDMKFYQVDIRNTPFPDSFFDQIVAVSTIEHVGQGEMPDNGDIVAMRELSRILKEDGKMLITLPFAGEYSLKKGRNYDEKRLRLLIRGLSIEKEDYYACCGKGKWVKASKEEAEAAFSPTRPMAVGCLVLRKRH